MMSALAASVGEAQNLVLPGSLPAAIVPVIHRGVEPVLVGVAAALDCADVPAVYCACNVYVALHWPLLR
jgi:hypothetical protein